MKPLKLLLLISILFFSIGQLSAELYLPSLPFIAHDLHTTANLAQASVALFMLGYCIAHLIYGSLSDAIGRKKTLIGGLLICLIGTASCLLAHNIYSLIIGRFIQGIGASATPVLAGAIFRDMFEGRALAKYDSYLSMASGILLGGIPVIGGYLQYYFDWRANFVFLCIYTLLILTMAIFMLPETNLHHDNKHLKLEGITENIKTLFTNRIFLISSTMLFLVYGGIFAWLTAGPIVLQKIVGFTPIQYGWTTGLAGGCYFIGALLNSRMVENFGILTMLRFGVVFLVTGAIFLLLPAMLSIVNSWVIIPPVMLFVFGSSMIFPNIYAISTTYFPKIAGTATGLVGTIEIAGGFVASSIISSSPDNNQIPLAIIFLICSLLIGFLVKNLAITYIRKKYVFL